MAGASILQALPIDNAGRYIQGTLTYNGTISNNTVSIYNANIGNRDADYVATIKGYNGIYGGIYQGVETNGPNGDLVHTFSITNNTVNIGFGTTLGNRVNIGGGAYNLMESSELEYCPLTPNANAFDGNTLNLDQLTHQLTVNTIANFENINFILNENKKDGDILIEVNQLFLGNGLETAGELDYTHKQKYIDTDTDTATDTDGDEDYNDNLTEYYIVSVPKATKYTTLNLNTTLQSTLKAGDTITLFKFVDIEEETGTYKDENDKEIQYTKPQVDARLEGHFANLDANNNGTYIGTKGVFLGQTWDIKTQTDAAGVTTMTATLISTQGGEQSKVFGEASLAGMTALTNSTDLLVGQAIPSASKQVKNKQESQGSGSNDASTAAFMVTGAGMSRYNTGSHVDSNSVSLNAGIAKGGKGMHGDWLFGGFFEYNYGNYSTYNSFRTGTVEGDGKVNAYGVGAFTRYDINHAEYKPYVEGSYRLGYMKTEYAANDLFNSNIYQPSVPLSYDTDNMYMSMHLGVGNIFDINDKLSIDTSFKYFWTHQSGDNDKNFFGHNVEFGSSNSHRVRLNGRADYTLKDDDKAGRLNTYGGLGLEYEFDGKARNVVDGYKASAPDLKGITAIGELGLNFIAKEDTPLSINLGMQTFIGKREGVSANLQFVYKF